MWLSLGLAFVGGYGDAASFVLAKTFTGHVTGNLVLAAIAVAAHDWRATLAPLSAIVTFLIGIVLSVLIVRPLKTWSSWPLLPTVMGIEVILLVAASLALSSGLAQGVGIFVIFLSLALGLQNGAFRRVGGKMCIRDSINAAPGFGEAAAAEIEKLTNLPFISAPNKFTVQGAHDALSLIHI